MNSNAFPAGLLVLISAVMLLAGCKPIQAQTQGQFQVSDPKNPSSQLSEQSAKPYQAGHSAYSQNGLTGHLWYPTVTDEKPKPKRYMTLPVAASVASVEAAPLAPGKHPLIVVSHGILGEATSYAWLCAKLARDGAVVLAPDHHLQSRRDLDEAELFRFTTDLWPSLPPWTGFCLPAISERPSTRAAFSSLATPWVGIPPLASSAANLPCSPSCKGPATVSFATDSRAAC